MESREASAVKSKDPYRATSSGGISCERQGPILNEWKHKLDKSGKMEMKKEEEFSMTENGFKWSYKAKASKKYM